MVVDNDGENDAFDRDGECRGDFSGRPRSAPPVFRSAPLPAYLEESDSEGWDFYPLSASSSDSSEIPEAILEESSDDDHRPKPQALSGGSETECSAVENSSSLQSGSLTKPVLISAWTS